MQKKFGRRRSWLVGLILVVGIFLASQSQPQVRTSTTNFLTQINTKLQPYLYLVRASISNRLQAPLAKDTAEAASTNETVTATETPLKNLTTSNEYFYYFEDNVPADVCTVFQQAVAVYNQTGLVKLTPGTGTTNKNKVTFYVYQRELTNPAAETVELGNGGPTTLSWNHYAVNSGRAGLNLAYPYISVRKSVAVHELGHALGLAHSNSKKSVMYPIDQGLTALSAADLAGLEKIYQ